MKRSSMKKRYVISEREMISLSLLVYSLILEFIYICSMKLLYPTN